MKHTVHLASKLLFSAALFFSPLYASTVNLYGTVFSTSQGDGEIILPVSLPVAGAEVKLQSDASISTTTDSDGRFALTAEITSVLKSTMRSLVPSAVLNGSFADVTLTSPSDISISVYSVSGRMIDVFNSGTLDPGLNRVALPVNRLGAGVYMVTVLHEGNRSVLRYVSSAGGNSGLAGHTRKTDSGDFAFQRAAGAPDVTDTLVITAEGYRVAKYSLSSYEQEDISILLERADEWRVAEDTLTDPDGNTYSTVQIGRQVWTVENLRTTKYADGTPIPHVTDNSEWSDRSSPAYCYYNNTSNSDSIAKFGALYNWYTVADTNSKSIAPAGWRAPTGADWDVLTDYLIANGYNWDGATEGNKIGKALASDGGEWSSVEAEGSVGDDQGSNNSTGFSALPGGWRGRDGNFGRIGDRGSWWSAEEFDMSYAYYHRLNYSFEYLRRNSSRKWAGYSVRLVKGLD